MPTPTRLISLNIGSQTVVLAEFRHQAHGGLVLLNYRLREMAIDPAGDPAARARREQVAIVLRDMMDELQIKRDRVNYAVPAQSVFARFVKLPAVNEEKIDKIVSFEAQQNVPFPIEEVVWDYQLVGGGGDEQIQVVLVAIKRDLLEDINGAVEETGLRTAIVDVAPMAIYNAFRYNYSDLHGCSLLVDIGARTTNLLFIEPERIFSRSVPLGGSLITAAIAKEFGESFAAAEFRKKRDGFVSLGGAYAEPADPEVARVSKLVRSTMTRLHAELMRSISYYRAQQHGSPPMRIFLCGGSAGMPYLREFFNEKLRLPIEFFNPLRNVAAAGPAPEVAVTKALIECPTSAVTGRYVSAVAPVIGAQFAPAASQRRHWYVNRSGLPPCHVPGTAASSCPATGGPTMVGGVERRGTPVGYASMATDAGLVPFIRSPSLQCLIPGTVTQFDHCQNLQPSPSQFCAGTSGALFDVQCAIQRPVPTAATAVESPSRPFQKSGDV